MRKVIAFSLRFRSMIVAFACGIMLLGATQLASAPVDVFPEFSPPRVEVQTVEPPGNGCQNHPGIVGQTCAAGQRVVRHSTSAPVFTSHSLPVSAMGHCSSAVSVLHTPLRAERQDVHPAASRMPRFTALTRP